MTSLPPLIEKLFVSSPTQVHPEHLGTAAIRIRTRIISMHFITLNILLQQEHMSDS